MKKLILILSFLLTFAFAQSVEDLTKSTPPFNNKTIIVLTIPTEVVGTDTTWRTRRGSIGDIASYLADSLQITDDSLFVTRTNQNQKVDGRKSFYQGLRAVNFSPGLIGGSGWGIIEDSRQIFSTGYTGYLDNLYVRNNIVADNYLINQTTFQPGNVVISNGAVIDTVISNDELGILITANGDTLNTFSDDAVQTANNVQRAVIKVHDPDNRDQSPLKKGDLFQITKHAIGGALLQTIRGGVARQDGRKLTVFYDTGTLEAGDNLVSRGNLTDETRQNSMALTINDPFAPKIELFQGVNNFTKLTDGSARTVVIGNLNNIETSEFGTLSGTGAYFPNGTLYAENGRFSGNLLIGSTLTNTDDLLALFNSGDLALKDLAGINDVTFISGGKIITDVLTADSVRAGTLTGVTVQSASGNDRIVLSNGNTLGFYDGSTSAGTLIGDSYSASSGGGSAITASDDFRVAGDLIAGSIFLGRTGGTVSWGGPTTGVATLSFSAPTLGDFGIQTIADITCTSVNATINATGGVSGTFTTLTSVTITNGIVTSYTP